MEGPRRFFRFRRSVAPHGRWPKPDRAGPRGTAPVAAETGDTVTVFQRTRAGNWSERNPHRASDGGRWTTAPGTVMEAACADRGERRSSAWAARPDRGSPSTTARGLGQQRRVGLRPGHREHHRKGRCGRPLGPLRGCRTRSG
ncbi:hypothetical protein LJ221_17000 [Streptomyces sp. CNQ085]|nr:carbohydrate binding domain-containing protein [Streptomyces sp. CNQ085]MCI0385976.1 hypothetical protein [Streptomyces sp. CNQ085]